MKKILLAFILLLNVNLFGFKLSSTEFEERLNKNQTKEKSYLLTNNTDEVQRYRLATTSKNVSVSPKSFVLGAGKSKEIKLKAIGRGKKGDNRYYFVVEESLANKKKAKKNGAKAYLKSVIRFEQSYYLN